MLIDSKDSFLMQLVNAAAEIADSLAVGAKPVMILTGSLDVSGKEIREQLQTRYTFMADMDGIDDGRFIIMFDENIALSLAATLMGADKSENLGSGEKSAVFELFNNIAGRWKSEWGEAFGTELNLSGQVILEPGADNPDNDEEDEWIQVNAGIQLDSDESEIAFFFPKNLVDTLESKLGLTESDDDDEESNTEVEATMQEKIHEKKPEAITAKKPEKKLAVSDDDPSIRPAKFQQFEDDISESKAQRTTRSIDLIFDVPLLISVELGRKELTIKEILELSPGSMIELNQLAGEPVDLLINGKLFARGEVVVIDENFGIRVTAIISPKERVERIRQ
ncbi:flagellar motor switch protein FliN [bacterium]|nr:flagellar motor switch protein FliN [bacterium]MBU1024540.1 flagellar motor switch protein FliN [bacterium]